MRTFFRCPRARSDTNLFCQLIRPTKTMDLGRRDRNHDLDRIHENYSCRRRRLRYWTLLPTFLHYVDTFWPPTTYDRTSFASFRRGRVCVAVAFQVSRYFVIIIIIIEYHLLVDGTNTIRIAYFRPKLLIFPVSLVNWLFHNLEKLVIFTFCEPCFIYIISLSKYCL